MLIINGVKISSPMHTILNKLKIDSKTHLMKDISEESYNNISITCPKHKNGHEAHPSCRVYSNPNGKIEYGKCHCFTCGWVGSLYDLVNICFGSSDGEFGKKWLVENFGGEKSSILDGLSDIVLNKPKKTKMNESELNAYQYYHPYMYLRKISKNIIDDFEIGYDNKTNSLIFPVRDEHNQLLFITSRNVSTKSFHIPPTVDKPVYLMNYVKQRQAKTVVVAEGQLDALVSWSYGMPAVALFGSGTTEYQMSIINKSGVRHWVLMYDNDEAGRKGANRFKSMVNKDSIITDILMPINKDIGDCTKDEFLSILHSNNINL